MIRPGLVWRWAARNQFLAALVLIGLLVGGVLWRDNYRDARERDRDRAQIACIAAWADAFTARTTQLLTSNTALRTAADDRADALDVIFRDISEQLVSGRQDRRTFEANLRKYVAASDRYRTKSDEYVATQEENPVPDPPRIRC